MSARVLATIALISTCSAWGTAAAYAISIQIACCSDSIVAFGRIADDFFNSIGTKRTSQPVRPMSAFGGKADIAEMNKIHAFGDG
jgi:hypothetical protein